MSDATHEIILGKGYGESWKAESIGPHGVCIVEDASGQVVIRLDRMKRETNARLAARIVACVNALAGIPTEALTDVLAQRDKLLEACKNMRKRIMTMAVGESPLARDWVESYEFADINAAIALAEPKTEPTLAPE